MSRWTTRLLLLGMIAAVVVLVRSRRAPAVVGPTIAPESTWPPFAPARATDPAPVSADAADWVAPVDGTCPEGYPIKANDSSKIFHVPGGRFYERTKPERCYSTADAAERDGYRRAKA